MREGRQDECDRNYDRREFTQKRVRKPVLIHEGDIKSFEPTISISNGKGVALKASGHTPIIAVFDICLIPDDIAKDYREVPC